MMPTLISSWRKVWSAEPGTTDPLAPFGLVSLADGTDEGYGINMRQFRWAQTANYGPSRTLQRPAASSLKVLRAAAPCLHRCTCTLL